MPDAHRIRLRGPWQCRPVEQSGSLPGEEPKAESIRIELAAPWWDVATERGWHRIALTRFFHRPTGLTRSSRVDLVIESFPAGGTVLLNGQHLCQFEPHTRNCVALGDDLQLRNELLLVVDLTSQPPGDTPASSAEVQLEIYS